MTRKQKIIAGCTAFLLLEIFLVYFVDLPLSLYLRELDSTHHDVINFFRAYTDLGKSKFYLWPSAFGILVCVIMTRMQKLPRHLREHAAVWGNRFMIIFAAMAISGLIANVLKPLISRARPVLYLEDTIYGFHAPSFHAHFNSQWNSMPSGHSTTAFALAFILSMLFPRLKTLWWIYGIALAFSRIMVNAHYFSDVLAGCAVAYASAFFIKQVLTRYGMFHSKHSFFPIDRKQSVPLKNEA